MKHQVINILTGCMAVAGLLLAGCECEYPFWPWLNLAGLAVFGGSLAWASSFLNESADK